MQRQRRKLTVEDRVVIELRRKDGWGVRAIARELGRSPSVISAELGRRTGRPLRRRAGTGRGGARWDRSGRRAMLAPDSPLFAEVAKLLRLQWSPEQIAGRRKRLEDGTEVSSGLRVSHEAIYQAIYAVPRGELRRELLACLRQGKPHRGRRSKDGERRGRICDMTSIRERPAEVEERLVPGHWEGDLIKGAGNRSSVGTLVERASRKLVLVKLTDAKAETARDGFAAGLLAVPAPLRLTLTYDQGKEMARHKELAALTGLRVTSPTRMPPGSAAPTRTPTACCASTCPGRRPVGVLAGRARRDRRPAQQSAAQDARLRDPRRGVRRAGGQGRQRRHGTKCGGCSLRNLNPPAKCPTDPAKRPQSSRDRIAIFWRRTADQGRVLVRTLRRCRLSHGPGSTSGPKPEGAGAEA